VFTGNRSSYIRHTYLAVRQRSFAFFQLSIPVLVKVK
jgi:hypothetical protein